MRFVEWLSFAAALSMSAALFLFPAPLTAQDSLAAQDSCLAPRAAPPVPHRPGLPDGLAIDPPIDTVEACPAWRWVAVKRSSDRDCPKPGTVFDDNALEFGYLFETTSPAGLPRSLRPFCSYQVKINTDFPAEILSQARDALNQSLEGFIASGELREVESGCAAVSPMASKEQKPVWKFMRDHFLRQAGRWPASEERQTYNDKPRVRLALLDTQPTEKSSTPNSNHGLTLGRMAQKLSCPGQTEEQCSVQVASRLALPIFKFNAEDPSITEFSLEFGGFYGTIDQLAQGVWEELKAWPQAEQDHLILNLSVAWVGERFGGLERRVSRMPIPVRALYRVLEVASCRDVLVVAASGNRIGGPDIETGPLLPAAWENRPAPKPGRCAKILGKKIYKRRHHAKHEPLVYAAGGIQSDGAPLANARPDSEPPRVAYADHAVVQGTDADSPTAILTGSSVAAAVVSSAAAVVWNHRPELSRSKVMNLLQRSGDPVGRRADFHLRHLTPGVKRIEVCPALATACAQDGQHCPKRGYIWCSEASRQPPDLSQSQSEEFPDRNGDISQLTITIDDNQFCQFTTRFGDNNRPAELCPFQQFFAIKARPWAAPQPDDIACSGCSLKTPPPAGQAAENAKLKTKDVKLHINIDPNWSGGPLTSAVLYIGKNSYALPGLHGLEANQSAIVGSWDRSLLAPDDNGHRPSAVLYFQTDHGSVANPVFISLNPESN